MSRPRVSVLMSVYNGERYLRESVESILNQTFKDFEFIIVDDASEDASLEILETYRRKDTRIRLVQNANNIGLTSSLNKVIQMSRGDYLARQDADDISESERLVFQLRFLEDYPDVGVLGTWVAYVDKQGQRTGIWQTPTTPSLVRWSLFFGNSIAHPSVMLRSSLVEGGVAYRPEISYAQDYDLWVRLSAKTQLTNLPEILYLRRVHEEMIGVKHYEQQDQTVRVVMRQAIMKVLGEEVSDVLIGRLWHSSRGELLHTPAHLEAVATLILDLYRIFSTKNTFGAGELAEVKKDVVRRLKNLALSHVGQQPSAACRVLWQSILLERGLPVTTCLKMMYRFLAAKLKNLP